MKAIDRFLTGKAQALWPSALVYRETNSGTFYLERETEERVALSKGFADARVALYQLLRAERERRNSKGETS